MIINISYLAILDLLSKLWFLTNLKKNLTTEIKEHIKKSKFDALTNENDFLVKNLKKAG